MTAKHYKSNLSLKNEPLKIFNPLIQIENVATETKESYEKKVKATKVIFYKKIFVFIHL